MNAHRRDLTVAVLALVGAVFAVAQAAVVPALPRIDQALGCAPSSGTWMLTVNLLATALLTPTLGRLGDMHGKDRMLRIVVATLGAGTLVCALAPCLSVMLAGRVAQGAGGAVFPLAFGVLRDELDRDQIPGAIGVVSSLLGIGAGLGLVIAGPVVAAVGWRWLFWLPLGLLAGLGSGLVRCVPPSPVRTPGRIDLRAAVLMIAGLAALLVAVSEASVWTLTSARILGLLGAGAALLTGWVRRELSSEEPLVDMRMMALAGVWTTNLAAFLLGVGMYASIALVPALVQLPRSAGIGFGGSATMAGLFMLPTAAPQLLVGPLTGRIVRRIGSRAQLVIGMALILLAYLMLTVAHHHTWQLLLATTSLGLGLGFGLGALANLIVAAVDARQTGVATAMNTVMRTLGGAFGAAIGAGCLAGGGSLDDRFSLAFGICAVALVLGVGAALAIPVGRRGLAAARPATSVSRA